MRLRNGIRSWRDTYNNELCHEVDNKLALLLPEKVLIYQITLTQCQFEQNCRAFSLRKKRAGKFQDQNSP